MVRRRRRVLAIGGAIAALGIVAGAVGATSRSSDEAALAPTRHQSGNQRIEWKVENLLRQMTLTDKLEQLQLLSDGQVTDPVTHAVLPEVAMKGIGGVFSLTDPAKINALQHVAVDDTRLHIPILFAYDTIHGYRTIFPIPLGAASSFDPSVATADDTIAARETATVGIKQIYSPMVDVSHDPRWGRISEGAGEDPYLGSVFAAARVKAAQGDDYSAADKVIASVKHLVAYGQPEGGREYNTTDMSEARLRNLYLPPFKAAIDAGAATVMCSFNAINGVPGCANSEVETQILKKEWGFDGFIESDYTAVAELRACPPVMPNTGPCGHGVAADGPGAAAAALNAGTDSEMVSTNFVEFGTVLVQQRLVPIWRIDDAVRRILRIKFRAGLFDHPYVDQAKAVDPASFVTADDRKAARTAAGESMVLLKNDNATLPFDPAKKIAVIGPLGDDQHDMLGPWWGKGVDTDAVSLYSGIKDVNPTATFTQACAMNDVDPPKLTPADECGSDAGFPAAVAAANAADVVVLALGETRGQSGEAAARSNIDLPGKQQELIDQIKATGKPFVVVLFNGRPLTLASVDAAAPAILEAWFPGVEAGNAVADVLFGKVNPGGKLPVSFPRALGQIPIYYNHEPTGRPCDVTSKYNSRYRDLNSCDPLYAFGFGLSYTTFSVSNLRLSSPTVSRDGSVTATVDVTNTGARAGDDVVQLYIHDPVASISQPVRRLRGFQRVTLAPNEVKTITFTLDQNDYGFYNNRGRYVVEPGQIDVYAGDSSAATLTQSFNVTY
jgi:beta-glucosidase